MNKWQLTILYIQCITSSFLSHNSRSYRSSVTSIQEPTLIYICVCVRGRCSTLNASIHLVLHQLDYSSF